MNLFDLGAEPFDAAVCIYTFCKVCNLVADNALYGVFINVGALCYGDERFAAVMRMMPCVECKTVDDDLELTGMEKIHETKDKVDSGEIQLSEGETYTKEDLTKDITTTYIKTGMKLAKVYAPAIGLGAASLGCMFGSHHIMTKRNATLTAAYIALEQSFNGYKNRVADRFGERVQHELEQNVKAVEVETKKVDENGVEEVIKEYKDIAEQADDPCTLIFDETVDTWERDADLNRNYLLLMESAANKKLRSQGHLFLNEVLTMIGTHGGQSLRTPTGQVVGWVYNPNDTSLHNHVDFGLTSFESSDEALKSFLRGEERSVILHFNCDGIIIDKI